ncbi:tRNA (N(6)-L-threonylcarbamoyladenosine(37)-C(2))-methylthiotransferase MtaB [Candidatus Solincola sp.]|nr:tRNA (N(6)-L-threonylcarbamoyladenosine(37)-C(2))-methylthiotransferase MtaB [Actinomycetota bacterium]
MAVYSLGCKVNQAENEELAMELARLGHRLVRDPAEADLCVVNTCTVTAESDRKCRKLIRGLARRGACSLVVAGCYAELNPESLSRMPGVVALIPNREKDGWAERIHAMLPPPREPDEYRAGRSRGFIKVQDGCQRNCSYCVVPLARGPERSRPLDEVREVAARLLDRGCRELVLSGVNLGRYGKDEGYDLGTLVREILGLEGGFRVRLSSIELEDLRTEWLEEWSREERVCPHLHIPLQSGDDRILREMGRGYDSWQFLEMAGRLRRLWPGAALTTEVIVGYPGEDRVAFQRTVEVLRKAGVSRVHVFRFSPRPGTRAWERREKVDAEEAEKRSEHLRLLAERWRLEYIRRHLGEERDLLVEGEALRDGEKVFLGTTEDYVKALLRRENSAPVPGSLVRVRLEGVVDGRALAVPAGGGGSLVGKEK